MADIVKPDNDPSEEPALGTKQVLKYAENLAQTYEALQASEKQYRALWHIGKSLYQYIHMDDLVLHILKQIKETMNAQIVFMMLHDQTSNAWDFFRVDSRSESLYKHRESHIPKTDGLAERVFKRGEPEMSPTPSEAPQDRQILETPTDSDAESVMAVPLKTKKRIFGVLEVKNKTPFHDKDLFFLITLAPIISMALDNARMVADLDRAYKELKVSDRKKDHLIKHTREENIHLRQAIEERYRFDRIIGFSDPMLQVFQLCEKVMASDITVLVEGETGTGKELIARCIHHNSPRKDKLFVSQNCAGVPDTLLSSELFGHRRGAFTGAISDKKGLFEIADGGTIFLDEVAETSAAMQISLLRVLQEGEIKPLGTDYARKVDVRVISATHRNLEDDVKTGRFREDLLYRLNVFTIKLPPLRERTGDIPILAKYFIEKYSKKSGQSISGISPAALRCLEAYPFPGNVRELENEMERALAMAEHEERIEVFHLSGKIRQKSALACPERGSRESLKDMVENLEKSVIIETIKNHGGNKTRAAQELGLSRNGLIKKVQRYGL